MTTEQFARAHNTEILCGPIKLTSCLDLTEQSGTVTFTSPKLFKMRGRTLLVHIKALANTSSERETKLKSWPSAAFWDYNASTSNSGSSGGGSAVDRLASSVTNKKMEYNGCDWLHEISITVRKTKQTDVPNERFMSPMCCYFNVISLTLLPKRTVCSILPLQCQIFLYFYMQEVPGLKHKSVKV